MGCTLSAERFRGEGGGQQGRCDDGSRAVSAQAEATFEGASLEGSSSLGIQLRPPASQHVQERRRSSSEAGPSGHPRAAKDGESSEQGGSVFKFHPPKPVALPALVWRPFNSWGADGPQESFAVENKPANRERLRAVCCSSALWMRNAKECFAQCCQGGQHKACCVSIFRRQYPRSKQRISTLALLADQGRRIGNPKTLKVAIDKVQRIRKKVRAVDRFLSTEGLAGGLESRSEKVENKHLGLLLSCFLRFYNWVTFFEPEEMRIQSELVKSSDQWALGLFDCFSYRDMDGRCIWFGTIVPDAICWPNWVMGPIWTRFVDEPLLFDNICWEWFLPVGWRGLVFCLALNPLSDYIYYACLPTPWFLIPSFILRLLVVQKYKIAEPCWLTLVLGAACMPCSLAQVQVHMDECKDREETAQALAEEAASDLVVAANPVLSAPGEQSMSRSAGQAISSPEIEVLEGPIVAPPVTQDMSRGPTSVDWYSHSAKGADNLEGAPQAGKAPVLEFTATEPNHDSFRLGEPNIDNSSLASLTPSDARKGEPGVGIKLGRADRRLEMLPSLADGIGGECTSVGGVQTARGSMALEGDKTPAGGEDVPRALVTESSFQDWAKVSMTPSSLGSVAEIPAEGARTLGEADTAEESVTGKAVRVSKVVIMGWGVPLALWAALNMAPPWDKRRHERAKGVLTRWHAPIKTPILTPLSSRTPSQTPMRTPQETPPGTPRRLDFSDARSLEADKSLFAAADRRLGAERSLGVDSVELRRGLEAVENNGEDLWRPYGREVVERDIRSEGASSEEVSSKAWGWKVMKRVVWEVLPGASAFLTRDGGFAPPQSFREGLVGFFRFWKLVAAAEYPPFEHSDDPYCDDRSDVNGSREM